MEEFINLILSGIPPITFFTYMGFAYLGLILNNIIDVLKRKPESPDSPYKFKWKYWWADNKERLMLSLILIPLVVTLACASNEMLGVNLMNIATAFFIGWSGDGLSVLLKNKNILITGKIDECEK